MSMRIHHLNCGTLCPPLVRFLSGEGGPLGRGHMVCHCLLLETRDGLALVDTGIGMQDIEQPGRRLGRGFVGSGRTGPTGRCTNSQASAGTASRACGHSRQAATRYCSSPCSELVPEVLVLQRDAEVLAFQLGDGRLQVVALLAGHAQ